MVEELHPGGIVEVKGKLAEAFMASMFWMQWQAWHMDDLRERVDARLIESDDDVVLGRADES